MNLQQIIKDLKAKEGLNNEEIAKRLGVNKTTIGRWLKGDVLHLQEEPARRLAEWLGYDVDSFLRGKNVSFSRPVLGVVKAGYNLFADQNYLGEEEVDYKDFQRGDYFLKVSGNSMIGSGILDGSKVYVKKTTTLQNGEIGVFMVGEEVTVKKVIFRAGMMILEASNPEVENRYFSQKEIDELPVRILGKVLYCKIDFSH